MRLRSWGWLVPSVLACVLSCQVRGALTYSVTDLGSLTFSQSFGSAINNGGSIVGTFFPAGDGFVYANGAMQKLPGLTKGGTPAFDVNDSGQIVGQGSNGTQGEAVLINGASVQDLGNLGSTSQALGINSAGQVVGYSFIASGSNVSHAFLYGNGSMQDLGTFGGTSSEAYDINDSGAVVGDYTVSGADFHAFLYGNGAVQDLGTLGGSISRAEAINNSGGITGFAAVAGGKLHAFLYANGTMEDLGSLSANSSEGRGINGLGQVVGYYRLADNTTLHGFIYTEGSMLDLNDMVPANSGWVLSEARDVNDAGSPATEPILPGRRTRSC